MISPRSVYIGIDLAPLPGRSTRSFTLMTLDSTLRLQAAIQCNQAAAQEYLAKQTDAFVAIASPRRPGMGLMQQADFRRRLTPPPAPGRWKNYRVAEYLLRQHNLPIPAAPASIEKAPAWMRDGFELYTWLAAAGYQDYPHPESPRQLLEAQPHAAYSALLEHQPFARGTLEGRLQRQLILTTLRLRIPDPMVFFEEVTRHKLLHGNLPLQTVYTPTELDALAAAYTAFLAANFPERTCRLGEPEEGQIVLPVTALQETY